MWLSPILERFVLKDTASHIEKSPVTVILRALMEVVLAESRLARSLAPVGGAGSLVKTR